MQQRILRAQNTFYFGLGVILVTAILSAGLQSISGAAVVGLMLLGAILALGGRLRLASLQREMRQQNTPFGIWLTH